MHLHHRLAPCTGTMPPSDLMMTVTHAVAGVGPVSSEFPSSALVIRGGLAIALAVEVSYSLYTPGPGQPGPARAHLICNCNPSD